MTDENEGLHERCERCGAIGQDRRTLWIACLLDLVRCGLPLREVAVRGQIRDPVSKDPHWGTTTFDSAPVNEDRNAGAVYNFPFYQLRMCKGCRGDLVDALLAWFRSGPSLNARHNADERSDERDTVGKLTADAERVRVEILGLVQRANDITANLRRRSDEVKAHNGEPT